jgi:hypothetical protein
MADEIETTTPAEDAPAEIKPNDQARRILAEHRRQAVPVPAIVTASPDDVVTQGAAEPAPAKRKKPSGRKPTRRELAEQVKAFKAERKAGAPAAAPIAAPAAAASPEPAAPMLQEDEARAKFARASGKFFGMVFGLMAIRRGVHWSLSPDEKESLGEAFADAAACVEEFAPALAPYIAVAVKLAPLATLAGVTYELGASRLETDAAIERGEVERVMPEKKKPSVAVVGSIR